METGYSRHGNASDRSRIACRMLDYCLILRPLNLMIEPDIERFGNRTCCETDE